MSVVTERSSTSTIWQLLLADGRFPGGGFAHSGGLEMAINDGSVRDLATLADFTVGRLHTSGPLDAWLSGHATRNHDDEEALGRLDAEADAHQPSPALRDVSRSLGRGLRRAAAAVWADQLPAHGADHVAPVALGAVAGALGMTPLAAAELTTYHTLMTVVSAAPKLAFVDTTDALSIAARLAPLAASIAAAYVDAERPRPRSAPLYEARSDIHRHMEGRLFAS